MSRKIIVKGRIIDPNTVQLDEPLPDQAREVEVRAEVPDEAGRMPRGRLSDYLRSLPPGTRTKDDIDQLIREERDSWSR